MKQMKKLLAFVLAFAMIITIYQPSVAYAATKKPSPLKKASLGFTSVPSTLITKSFPSSFGVQNPLNLLH